MHLLKKKPIIVFNIYLWICFMVSTTINGVPSFPLNCQQRNFYITDRMIKSYAYKEEILFY